MVRLDYSSQFDVKKYPFLNSWDVQYRKNHAFYQEQIDKITYHLQRSQRGFLFLGQWFYPRYFQKDLLMLELYQQKQLVGKIEVDEVNRFKQINPEIADDLHKTFNSSWLFPRNGLAIGGGLFAFAHIFNYQYSFRFGLVLAPVIVDLCLQWGDRSSYFNSLSFLNWLVEFRAARGKLEYFRDTVQTEAFEAYKKIVPSKKPAKDLYGQFIELVVKEAPVE